VSLLLSQIPSAETDAGQVFIRGCKDRMSVLEKAVRLARTTQDEIQPVETIEGREFTVSVFTLKQ
jgi:hypothetical protein